MVFAAGLGTRLRPLTDHCPKALIEVGGEPMLGRIIRRLIDAGVTEVVVNVHHFADMIKSYLAANDNFGIRIHVSDESDLLLDTGGGILKAQRWLDGDEPFIVHNADILSDIELSEIYRRHVDSGAIATLLVARRNSSRYLLFGKSDGRLHGWINTATGQTRPDGFIYDPARYLQLAFGGIHVVSPRIFDSLSRYSSDPVFSIVPFYLSVCDRLEIRGYSPDRDYQWFDIGKPDSLKQANDAMMLRR